MLNTKSKQALQAHLLPVARAMNTMPHDLEWRHVGEVAGFKIEAYSNGKVYGSAIIYGDYRCVQGEDAVIPMATLLSAAGKLGQILSSGTEQAA